MKKLQARIEADQEHKALLEAERDSASREAFTERQNRMVDRLLNLRAVMEHFSRGTYRTTDRSGKNWLKCGLKVQIDSTKNEWHVEKISCEAWKKVEDHAQGEYVEESLMDGVDKVINQCWSKKR